MAYLPVMARVGNALGAAVRFVRSGFATVNATEQERRLTICQACEYFDAAQVQCRQCGCYLSLKVRLASEHCPLDPPKW